MNAKFGKTVAVVVASIMAAALTAGCGNNGGSSTSGQDSTAASTGSSAVSTDSSTSNPFSSAESTDTSTETPSTASEPQPSEVSQPEPSTVESSDDISTIIEISEPRVDPGKLSDSFKTLAASADKAEFGLYGLDTTGNEIVYVEINDGSADGEAVLVISESSVGTGEIKYSKSIYGPVTNVTQGTTPEGNISASVTVTDKVTGESETISVVEDSTKTVYTVTLASGGTFTSGELDKGSLSGVLQTFDAYANGNITPPIIDDLDPSDDDDDTEGSLTLPSGISLDDLSGIDDLDDLGDLDDLDDEDLDELSDRS